MKYALWVYLTGIVLYTRKPSSDKWLWNEHEDLAFCYRLTARMKKSTILCINHRLPRSPRILFQENNPSIPLFFQEIIYVNECSIFNILLWIRLNSWKFRISHSQVLLPNIPHFCRKAHSKETNLPTYCSIYEKEIAFFPFNPSKKGKYFVTLTSGTVKLPFKLSHSIPR